MIYIENNTILIQIPKHSNPPLTNSYTLNLYNAATQTATKYEDIKDEGDLDLIYQFGNLDFSNLSNGEYEYSLRDSENNLLETGILQVGNYKKEHKQYETKENERIGYVYKG